MFLFAIMAATRVLIVLTIHILDEAIYRLRIVIYEVEAILWRSSASVA